MNPDRNVQLTVASLGELTPTTSPVRMLLVVSIHKKFIFRRLYSRLKFCQTGNSLMVCVVHALAAPTPTTFSAATDTLS